MWVVAVPVYHCYLSNAIALPPLVGKPSGGLASQTYLDPLSKFQASTTRLFFSHKCCCQSSPWIHPMFCSQQLLKLWVGQILALFSPRTSSVFTLALFFVSSAAAQCSPTWPRGPCPSSSSTWAARWCTSLISGSELKPLSPTRHLRWWEWKGKW